MAIRKLHIRIPLKVKPEAPQVDKPTLRVFYSRPSMALSGKEVPRLAGDREHLPRLSTLLFLAENPKPLTAGIWSLPELGAGLVG